jgi:two-component system NtrC family sensor kinase
LRRPDVIVSDVAMPGMDGLALCQHVRADPSLHDTPLLLVSGVRKDSETGAQGFAAGADDFLELPCDHGRLVAKAARLVERKRVKDALQESEARVRLLLDSTAEAIFAVGLDGRCTLCNRAGLEMLGYDSPDDLIGASMHNRVHHTRADGRFYPESECAILAAVTRGQSAHIVNEAFWRRDGTSFPAEYWSHPILRAGQLAGAVVTFVDITERRRSEEELRRATERLHAVISSLPIALWAIDRDGIVTISEGALLERMGYRPGEQVGRSLFEIYADAPDVMDIARRSLAGESSSRILKVLDITFDSRYMPLRAADGSITGGISVAVDISDRVRLETQLRHAHKMEAVGRLAAGIAHDFNNLLTAIVGFGELIQLQLPPGDPTRTDAQEIVKAGRSAAALTRQLLAFSRNQVLQPEILDVNVVVRGIEALLRRTIGEHIRLVTDLAVPLGRISADAGQLEQVIMNLAINARDAMPAGGVLTLSTTNVTVDETHERVHPGAPAGAQVMLTISDSGVGMDATVQAHLFEPFYTTKERGKGTGLGLATVYGIVKQSGGGISVESERGRGTTFRIYLPRVERPISEPEVTPPTIVPGTETVLVVEDQAEVRSLARAVLSRHGYVVLEACNGIEALRLVQHFEHTIHLLLTDVVMPAMSGRDLARQLLELRPALRVLYTSGYTDGALLGQGALEKDAAFVQKPFTVPGLLQRVREVLDAR